MEDSIDKHNKKLEKITPKKKTTVKEWIEKKKTINLSNNQKDESKIEILSSDTETDEGTIEDEEDIETEELLAEDATNGELEHLCLALHTENKNMSEEIKKLESSLRDAAKENLELMKFISYLKDEIKKFKQ